MYMFVDYGGGKGGTFNPPLQDFVPSLLSYPSTPTWVVAKDFQYSIFAPLLNGASCSYLIEHVIAISCSYYFGHLHSPFNFHFSYSDEIVPSESSF